MNKGKWLVFGLLGLVLAVGLSGCKKITSASPDSNQIIEMKPGDKVIFEVVGPVNTPTTRCVWTITSRFEDIVSKGKNEFELNFNADSRLTNKENTITCKDQSIQPVRNCTEDGQCVWVLDWVTIDSRKWEVRVNPNSSTIITGDYIVENVSDLQFLSGYTNITGSLMIGPNIEKLEGLDKLVTIGDNLEISQNKYIENLAALESITSIGGLLISNDPALTSLSDLENIKSVSGSLLIHGCNSLTSLSGLENLTSVGGLHIDYNAALTNLSDLKNIKSVSGDLDIFGNAALTSLSGLDNITSVGGSLEIAFNDILTNLSGLNNITSVSRYVDIEWNGALTSLSGLQNLTSIGGDLFIYNNSSLTSLTGLENLKSVGGLNITDNDTLKLLGIAGLQKVEGYFIIADNPLLCEILAEELRHQVSTRKGIWGKITIEGNKECTTP